VNLKRKVTFGESCEILCMFIMGYCMGYIAVFGIFCGGVNFSIWSLHAHIFAKTVIPTMFAVTAIVMFENYGWFKKCE
jgi:predicted membrane protein